MVLLIHIQGEQKKNQPDSTGSIHVQLPNNVPNPAYPNPPGGQTPDLQLAQWPAQQGASIQPMPDPSKPDPMNYHLVGDPTMGGYEPSNPAPVAPNLAGVDGWPPAAVALAGIRSAIPPLDRNKHVGTGVCSPIDPFPHEKPLSASANHERPMATDPEGQWLAHQFGT